MDKVTIINGSMIYVGTEHVGNISGRGEVYVYFYNALKVEQAVARFKYRNPKASAVHWVKFILSKLSTNEIFEKLNVPRETPFGLAQKFGYVSYNEIQARKAGWIK